MGQRGGWNPLCARQAPHEVLAIGYQSGAGFGEFGAVRAHRVGKKCPDPLVLNLAWEPELSRVGIGQRWQTCKFLLEYGIHLV